MCINVHVIQLWYNVCVLVSNLHMALLDPALELPGEETSDMFNITMYVCA